jgi:hypothetical protein
MLSATTGQYGTIGSVNIFLKISKKFRTKPPNGYGHTTTKGLIWRRDHSRHAVTKGLLSLYF